MELEFVGRVASGRGALDHGIQGLEIVDTARGTYLLTTTGANGGLVSYDLGANGPARIVDTQNFPNALDDTASRMVDALQIGGGLQAAIGSAPNGALTGYSVSQDGQIGSASTAMVLPGVGQAVDCAGVALDSGAMIYVVDGATGRLSAHNAGSGTAQAAQEPVWQGGGGAFDFDRVETVQIGGSSVVLATGSGMDGVISYRVDGNTGALRHSDTFGATDGIGIGIPSDIVTVSAHGGQFAILAAAGSGSLTVMRVGANGALEATDHLLDTLHTRFGGVQAVDAVAVDGQVFVVAGGADDGLSLFSLLPDGRLVHLQSLAHETGTGLMNVSQIAVAEAGGDLQIMVGSQNAGGVSQFSLSLDDLGRVVNDSGGSVTLSGGAGDDLVMSESGRDTLRGNGGDDILVAGAGDSQMWGGAGADTFVLRDGGHSVTIRDFQAGTDRLEMTDFFFLRDVGQLQLNSTSWGARITFGDDRIDVRSMGGGSLDADDIFGLFGLTGPDRLLPFDVTLEPDTPPTPEPEPEPEPEPLPDPDPRPTTGGDGFDLSTIRDPFAITVPGAGGPPGATAGTGGLTLTGSGGRDAIRGRGDNDTIDLRGGHDRGWGNGGHDRIEGGYGADTLYGGYGNDVLLGEGGADLLEGGYGRDVLWGGSETDWLRGQGGNDFLAGGAGPDSLGGGAGNDTLMGGAGADTLWCGAGDDFVFGGNGNDLSTGFGGRDVLQGGNGRDTLWGGGGDDVLSGGFGYDVIGAGHGDDSVTGGDGNDRIFASVGEDLLNGGAGNDTIYMGDGADTAAGAVGDDAIYGGTGDDVLMGNAGDDLLTGGPGQDTLLGGNGADTFIFQNGHGNDVVVGFETGVDRIHIVTERRLADLTVDTTAAGDALIRFSGGQVVLDGVDAADLSASDFLFG